MSFQTAAIAEQKKQSRNHRSKRWDWITSEQPTYYWMMLPMLLFYILIMYKPMSGLLLAFKYYSPFKGIWGSEWVGMQYFREFFSGPYAFRTIRNTFTISLTALCIGFPIPVILALLLNELRTKRFREAVQTFTYIPHFISTVVVCGMVSSFLAPATGVVNTVLKTFGAEPVYFLSIPSYFVPIYVSMEIWKSTGYNSIVYIATLTSIDQERYEAATIDGANRWQQFLYVTFPALLPTIVIMLLIKLGGILNVSYEAIILLYNPSIYQTADVISTFVYRIGLAEGRYDYATAIGLFNSVVALFIVLIANKISNSLTKTGLW